MEARKQKKVAQPVILPTKDWNSQELNGKTVYYRINLKIQNPYALLDPMLVLQYM